MRSAEDKAKVSEGNEKNRTYHYDIDLHTYAATITYRYIVKYSQDLCDTQKGKKSAVCREGQKKTVGQKIWKTKRDRST